MIDLTRAKEADMFAQTFVADPDHDHFVGPEVPAGEAWSLTSLWMRAGKGGLVEAMLGVLSGEQFVSLASRRQLLEGDALSWSGDVLLTAGMAILFWTQGARQEEDIACSATWRVLSVAAVATAAVPSADDGGPAGPEGGNGRPKRRPKGEPRDDGQTARDS
jgi:hypothetical protein